MSPRARGSSREAGTCISPFQRIELYGQTGTAPNGGPVYRFVGTVPAGLVQDNPQGFNGFRVVTSSFTLTSTTSPFITAPAAGQNSYTVIAVAVNANGDALVSQPIQINVQP